MRRMLGPTVEDCARRADASKAIRLLMEMSVAPAKCRRGRFRSAPRICGRSSDHIARSLSERLVVPGCDVLSTPKQRNHLVQSSIRSRLGSRCFVFAQYGHRLSERRPTLDGINPPGIIQFPNLRRDRFISGSKPSSCLLALCLIRALAPRLGDFKKNSSVFGTSIARHPFAFLRVLSVL